MKFEINPQIDEPIHLQLREQIIFRISTGELQIGQVMPSTRALGRQLDISPNTVSSVYKELVEEKWLIERPGSRHIVVERKCTDGEIHQIKDMEDLISRTIHLAEQRGYSLQQLGARLQERPLEQPPDHLLIVEPEREMGEVMREELRRAIGQAPSGCSISALRRDPSRAIRAVLLTPSHLLDRLECIPAQSRNVVPLIFLPIDSHLTVIRNLPQPSIVGTVSVSPAILQTAGRVFAPVVGTRHTLHQFLMHWPVGRDGPRFKHYRPEDYPKERTPVRIDENPISDTDVQTLASGDNPPQHKKEDTPQLLSSDDLRLVDILFCDSIAYAAVKHRRHVRCSMLTAESIEAVAVAAKSLIKQ